MKTFRFVVEEHEDYGTIGLRMKNKPHFDPLGGMAVAHDILEHFPDDDGSIEHELMALGAMLWVRQMGADQHTRGRAGFWHRPASILAAEMLQQCNYAAEQGMTALRDPGRQRALDDEHVEQEIQDAWRMALQTCREEFSGDTEEYFHSLTKWLGDRAAFTGWLRKGYRRARRRYPQQWRALEVFMQIERKADAALRELEEYPGAEVAIAVNVAREQVSVRHNLWEE